MYLITAILFNTFLATGLAFASNGIVCTVESSFPGGTVLNNWAFPATAGASFGFQSNSLQVSAVARSFL